MRRRFQLPPLLVGIVALFVAFSPYVIVLSYSAENDGSQPPLLPKLLIGFGLFVSAALFNVAERLGILRTRSDLVRLFPEPEPEPEPLTADSLSEAVGDAVATVAPAGLVVGVIDAATEEAQDATVQAVIDHIAS